MTGLRPGSWGATALDLIAGQGLGDHAESDLHHDGPLAERLRRARIDTLLYQAAATDPPPLQIYRAAWAAQRTALDEAVAALAPRGVEPVLLKGAELFAREHGDHPLHLLADIDILVPRDAVEVVRRVFQDLGYSHDGFDRPTGSRRSVSAAAVAAAEDGHYELHPPHRVDGLALDAVAAAWADHLVRGPVLAGPEPLIFTTFDVHHGLASDLDGEDVLRSSVDGPVAGTRSPRTADHLWFVAFRHYMEVALDGKRSLRELVYLLTLARRPDVDWDIVSRAAIDHGLRSSLHYPLATLEALVPGTVPQEVLDLTDPRHGSREHDHGWQLGKLLDEVEPFPFPRPTGPSP